MRRTGGWAARRRTASAVTGIAVVALVAASMNGVASATPAGATAAAEPAVATNLAGPADVDHRTGSMKPTAAQASAAARLGTTIRWNAYGTPATLGPATLATGLAKDPVAAAKEYLTRNTALFGLDAKAVDALTTVAVSPLGTGAVVLLQQKFGSLPAGNDGLVALAVTAGKVVRVTSTLSRMTDAPAPATLTADQAVARAMADAKIPAGKLGSRSVRAVAVPTAAGPPGRVRGEPRRTRPGPPARRTSPTWTGSPARCWSARTRSTSTRTTRSGRSSRPARRRRTPPPARTPG